MKSQLLLLLTPVLCFTSCSTPDIYGGTNKINSVASQKPLEIDIKESNAKYVQARVSCRISGLSLSIGGSEDIKLGRNKSGEAPSLIMRLNEKKPATIHIIKEHRTPHQSDNLPVSGIAYSIDSKFDEKTLRLSLSGRVMASVRNPDSNGVMNFSKGTAYWSESGANKKDVSMYVKGRKVTFHFTWQLIDPTGIPVKLVNKSGR